MTTLSRRLFFIAGVVLVIAVGAQFIPKWDVPYYKPPKPLLSLMPTEVAGWEMKDRELGDTEFMRTQVKDILRYDDAFFRTYRRGNTEVGVYVAYWGPGMIHPIDAATHSPDLCWINAGWQEQQHDYEQRLDDGARRALKIAQFREFSMSGGQRQEVVFWHLMGGELSGYALGPSTRWRARQPVLWQNQLNTWFGFRRREQFFIRISTNQSMAELTADPLWREIIGGLLPTGLSSKTDKN